MKPILLIALATILFAGCRKIEVDGSDNTNTAPPSGGGNTILSGKINTDRTLETGNTYTIKGIVYVVDGARLTIEPGVIIKGEKSSRGTLVITRGSQIIANGTAEKPVVFTSDAATPSRGDWGGIVICGRAKTNNSFNGVTGVGEVEGGINNAEGLGLYGGADDNDNSGSLKYVRVEYAGYAYLPDKELNGITFCAVGKGTTVDYVQVSYANDDSFEWFGGSVDCKHLIAYKGLDDDFDTDNGFSGRVQYAIGFRDSLVADISGSNGFESDNDAGGSNLLPQTAPVFSNVTLIGPRATLSNIGNSNYKRAMHIRRNSSLSLFNSIIIGWPTGWLLDASTGAATDLNIAASRMVVANTIIAGNNTPLSYTPNGNAPTGFTTVDLNNYFNRVDGGNSLLANTADVQLSAPFKYDNSVDFNPAIGSPALTGATFVNAKIATWFVPSDYRGACGAGDTWWKSWTRFF
ncbi:MAG: hypothetical protein IPJ81_12540 [Chitinophagaceae bacterium]|nr:hypothetical protein [Chitinophagaceae bacterium]